MLKYILQVNLNSRKFSSIISLSNLYKQHEKVIQDLVEVKHRELFKKQLKYGKILSKDHILSKEHILPMSSKINQEEVNDIVTIGFLTFLLHVEARIASSIGQGYYTIGPCGEELLGIIGLHLHSRDASALHYRHVSTALMRQYKKGEFNRSIEDIALDRARG